ncbi:MAG: serine/threonine-protein kinase, partial [Planctomycetota bacterium]
MTSSRSLGTLSASKVLDDLMTRGVAHNRYRVRDELARGGMGAVLEAWDQDLRRRVAMKVMLSPRAEPRSDDSVSRRERTIGRFLEEAQVTGQLEHPSIVPVYELSLDADGRLFFTMPLVRGRDFEQVIQAVRAGEDGWTEQKALRLLLRVCEAMAYAHDKGVVHRDLKPANLMTGNYGEVYVMDWGVARIDRASNVGQNTAPRKDETLHRVQSVRSDESDQGDSTLSTLDGEVVGTPSYMAPEQARGELERVDARADVYSIGAILYQLISGVRPYAPPGSRRTVLEVLDLVRESAPEPLVELAPDGNPELIAIASKAMERESKDRYATMAELADDLGRHLDGFVVSAYEKGRRAVVRKWVRRNRATATWAAVAAGGLILGLAGVTVVQARANRSLEESNYRLGVLIEALEQSEREAKGAAETARIERDASESVAAFLEDLFESPDPSRAQGERVTAKTLLDRGASALADPEQLELDGRGATRFGLAIGRAYNALGLAEDALPLLERGHQDLVENYGREDAATLAAQVELGDALTALEETERASELLDDAVRRSRYEFGSSAESTLLAERGLAALRFRQGEYDEAIELLEHVLEQAPEVFGARSVERFDSMRLLARIQRKADRLDVARTLLVTAFEGLTDVVGEDDPRTLMALNNLAGIDLFE